MIPLVKNTINTEDLRELSNWLLGIPKLTKGELTGEFEKTWSEWLGVPYSVFLNSGSSANLLMLDVLVESGRLKSKKVIAPAVSWSTTVAPMMQLGLEPILCDADEHNLGLDLNHLEDLLKKEKPAVVTVVHVLGVPNLIGYIRGLCKRYGAYLLEDCCEAVGSSIDGLNVGTFGEMSSWSFYYGHHISTIEGGMLCCHDPELYSIALSLRSHGWARDLDISAQRKLETAFEVGDFDRLYTFYYPGYNFRPTDLNAFLGLRQLKRARGIAAKRNANYHSYKKNLEGKFWIQTNESAYISSFAFGLIDERRAQIIEKLRGSEIESRPLICGSIGHQPFWIKKYGRTSLKVADRVSKYGFYLPNNHELTDQEIDFICGVVKNA